MSDDSNMTNNDSKPTELTDEQKVQHNHVLQVAKNNLSLVIDQVESLSGQKMYDDILSNLDTAKASFDKELN